MSFKSYIADKEASFSHIREVIRKTKNKVLREKINNIISFGLSEYDIAMDCWIKAWGNDWESSAQHKKEYCGKVISDIFSGKIARKTTSVVTYYSIRKLHNKLTDARSIESKLLRDHSFDMSSILSSGMNYDQKKILLLLDLGIEKNSEYAILLSWVINDSDESDAMKSLNCSRRTLYRKQLEFFNYLKKKFYKYKR